MSNAMMDALLSHGVKEKFKEKVRKCEEGGGLAIDASNLGLPFIPDRVLTFENLKALNLRENNIELVHDELFEKLRFLEIINLSRNCVRALPFNLTSLSRLRKLYLPYNSLSEVPESLSGLLFLEELYLQHNRIKTLPNSIGDLEHLVTLNVASNQITSIPKSLLNCKNLLVVDISENPIEYCPESIRRLHDKHTLLQSQTKRQSLIKRALKVKKNVAIAAAVAAKAEELEIKELSSAKQGDDILSSSSGANGSKDVYSKLKENV